VETLVESAQSFMTNLVIVFIIVRFIYYPQRHDKDYVFTFFAFNTVVYFVMGLLNNTDISTGAGSDCSPFSRSCANRTNTIPIREMTYLLC